MKYFPKGSTLDSAVAATFDHVYSTNRRKSLASDRLFTGCCPGRFYHEILPKDI